MHCFTVTYKTCKMAASRASASLQAFKQVWKLMASGKNYDKTFNKVNIVSVSPVKCHCELTVDEEHTNVHGLLHGGFTTSLVDYTSTLMATVASKGSQAVSIQVNMSLLQSAKLGEKIDMEIEVVKIGKTVAFTKGRVSTQDGDIIAQGNNIIMLRESERFQQFYENVMKNALKDDS